MQRNPVTLQPYDDSQLSALLALKVKPFQQTYCANTRDIVANLASGQTVHVIYNKQQLVGCFVVDTRFHFTHTFANSATPAVVNFMINQDQQALGLASETCRMLPIYLRQYVPLAKGLFSLVNQRNVGAYKAGIRGGWQDTQNVYTQGHTGPKHILWMPF